MYDLTCLAHISSLACIGTVFWCSRVGLQAIREMSEQMTVVLSVSAAFRVTTLLHAYFFFTVYIIYNQFSNRVWFTLRKAMIWHWALPSFYWSPEWTNRSRILPLLVAALEMLGMHSSSWRGACGQVFSFGSSRLASRWFTADTGNCLLNWCWFCPADSH